MKKEIYFIQIWDKEKRVHELKSVSISEIKKFISKNKREATGIYYGSRKVPGPKLQYCIENVSIENLMTLSKE